jgi:hypothetical protein
LIITAECSNVIRVLAKKIIVELQVNINMMNIYIHKMIHVISFSYVDVTCLIIGPRPRPKTWAKRSD